MNLAFAPHRRNAFTVVELVAVIIVLVIVISLGTIALSHLRRDSLRTQADNNTTILNQAATRARLKDMQGPGTYGSDKHAALQWYLQHNLIQKTQTPNISLNTYENGRWFSNLIDFSKIGGAEEFTSDQVAELLRRYREWTPQLAKTLLTRGLIKATPDIQSNIEDEEYDPQSTVRVGNTLLSRETFESLFSEEGELEFFMSVQERTLVPENSALFNPDSAENSTVNNVQWTWDANGQYYYPNTQLFPQSLQNLLSTVPAGSDLEREVRKIISVSKTELLQAAETLARNFNESEQGRTYHQTEIAKIREKAKTIDTDLHQKFTELNKFQQAIDSNTLNEYLSEFELALQRDTYRVFRKPTDTGVQIVYVNHQDQQYHSFIQTADETRSYRADFNKNSQVPSAYHFQVFDNVHPRGSSSTSFSKRNIQPQEIYNPHWQQTYSGQFHHPSGVIQFQTPVNSASDPQTLSTQGSRAVNVHQAWKSKLNAFRSSYGI